MTTRNFITILSILFTLVMVSCSTEGDILDDMAKVEAPATPSVEATVSCSIYNVGTKSTTADTLTAVGNEANTANAIFFLVRGNNVLASSTTGKDIYTKNQSGLSVLVVAGISTGAQDTLSNMSTVKAIKEYTLTNLNNFTKIGEADVNFDDAAATKAVVTVKVRQVVARIDLVAVNITKTAADNVTLTKVELINQVVEGKLNGEVVERGGVVEGSLNPENNGNVCSSFYSFAGKEVSLRLTFNVDGKEVKRKFTVKHSVNEEEVKAGHVYRITFNAKITGENVEPTVTFEVADWKSSTVSGDMVEVN